MFSKIYLLAFILVITLPVCVFGQTIKGRILDFQTKKGIPSCSVYILNKPVGVISNPNGYFVLHGIDKNDTLVISSLGYQTWRGGATALLKKDSGIFYLKRNSELLPTLVINSLPPTKLVQLCLKKSSHVLTKKIILNTYYREYFKVNGRIMKFADGMVKFFINGSPNRINIQVTASRCASDLPSSLLKNQKRLEGGIKMGFLIKRYFKIPTSAFLNYDSLSYSYVESNSKTPYFIIKGTRKKGGLGVASIKWYFNKSDSLLVKAVTKYLLHDSLNVKSARSANIVVKRGKITATFKNLHGKLYMNYAWEEAKGNLYWKSSKKSKRRITVVSELMVNDIDTKHFHKLPRRLRYKKDHLYENGTHFTTPFWKTENIIAATPEEKAFMSKIDSSYSSGQ